MTKQRRRVNDHASKLMKEAAVITNHKTRRLKEWTYASKKLAGIYLEIQF